MDGTTIYPPAAGYAPWHHFAGLLLVILLAVLQGRVGRIGTRWQICWALPGTLLHELSHLLVAAVTGGRPVGFSIVPRRQTEGASRGVWVLGSVTISRPGPLSALPSALAPLALNAVAYYLYLGWGGVVSAGSTAHPAHVRRGLPLLLQLDPLRTGPESSPLQPVRAVALLSSGRGLLVPAAVKASTRAGASAPLIKKRRMQKI